MDLSGKLALVTGASRGIGYQCAKALGARGCHVIATARTVGGLEELDDEISEVGGSTTLVPLDLIDFEAIDRLGASIYDRWGKLDVLVSSAAMLGGLSPIEHFDPKSFEKTMGLNVTANWRLMRSMSTLLREADAGRAIFMTADVGREPKPFWGTYSASKAALESLVRTWASECNNTKLRVNLLDPGPMRTALRAAAMPGEDKMTLAHPSEIADALYQLVDPKLTKNGKCFMRETMHFEN